MLFRRRLTGLDAIFGLLHELPPTAGGAPTGDPAPGAPPPATGNGGGGAPPAPTGQPAPDDRSGWIPRQRFDEVNTRLQALEAAETQKKEDEAKARGDFEAVNAAEKAKTKEAEEKAVRIARRAAFISKAATKVADADAAYKLAFADGMLNDLAVNDEGDADPKIVDKIVDDLLKKYEFLKGEAKSRSFGDARNGTDPGPIDTSKMTGSDMLRAGYAQIEARGGSRGS